MLMYVGLIKEEKLAIQRFLSGFPSFYRDKIQYDEPSTLEEAIRKAKHMYDQNKGRNFFWKYYGDKIKEYKQDERKKGFKPSFFKN